MGRSIITVSLAYVVFAAVTVFLATHVAEGAEVTALLPAGIAPASAPAATLDVIRENHAKGNLARTLMRMVAIDNAYGIVLFSSLLAVAGAISGRHRFGAASGRSGVPFSWESCWPSRWHVSLDAYAKENPRSLRRGVRVSLWRFGNRIARILPACLHGVGRHGCQSSQTSHSVVPRNRRHKRSFFGGVLSVGRTSA